MRAKSLALLAGLLVAAAPAYASRAEIILDVSGSMRASLSGVSRIEAARKAIRATLAGVPPDSVMALRLYGHRVPQQKKAESCHDTELTVPFGQVDKAAFLNVVDRAEPKGQTPLTYALEQAARDFGPAGDEQRMIILVSDGGEDCGGDPVAAVRNLMAQGFKVKVHTVGIDVDQAAQAQLQAISGATGGEYHDARSAAALADSLTQLAQQALIVNKGSDTFGEAIRGGDGYDSAVALQPGKIYHLDHHQRKAQYDYFYVDLKGRQKVSASIETPQAGVEISGDRVGQTASPYAGVVLQDGSRQKLGDTEIVGDRGGKKTLEGTLASGKLYVLIGNSYGDQPKDSRFSVEVADLPGDAGSKGDAGNTERDAMPLKPASYTAYLDAHDVDWYKFRADPNASYAIRVRPTSEQAWVHVSVADYDGVVAKEGNAPNAGGAVRFDTLRFQKGGDVFVRVSYDPGMPGIFKPDTDYSLDITQEGAPQTATAVASQAPAASPAATAGGEGSVLARMIRAVMWAVLWLGSGLLIGVIAGYLLGRRGHQTIAR